jgi:NAD(P)-dependent dehydrogenase (short-subunit alcohol dehydrogenase family)
MMGFGIGFPLVRKLPRRPAIDQTADQLSWPGMEHGNALIIGASGGIGQALARACAPRYRTLGLSRSADGLDITSQASVDAALHPLDGPFDLCIVATGALQVAGQGPEKSLRQVSEAGLRDQFAVNAIGPALLLRHAPRLLPRDRRAVFAVLSARVGSIGDNHLGGWYGYRAAKAAVNQIVHTAAIEIARTHPRAICVALHPGTVATPFTRDFVSPDKATPPDDAARNLLSVLDRLTPADSGRFFDYAGIEIPW